MNLSDLENKLIAAARKHPPSEAVPYAFEKRIMTRIQSRHRADPVSLWAASLWRAALACLAITLALGAWTHFKPAPQQEVELPVALEEALFAELNQNLSDTW